MPNQPTLTDFFKPTSTTSAGSAEDEPPAKRPREELPGTVFLDCRKVLSKRRRTRAEVAAEPVRVHRDVCFKLCVVAYSKQYGVNVASQVQSVAGINLWPRSCPNWKTQNFSRSIILTWTLMMGHKLIRMVQLTPMTVVELMTLTVTMMVSVTGWGQVRAWGVEFVPCFRGHPVPNL